MHKTSKMHLKYQIVSLNYINYIRFVKMTKYNLTGQVICTYSLC